jgi:hypothetical protein
VRQGSVEWATVRVRHRLLRGLTAFGGVRSGSVCSCFRGLVLVAGNARGLRWETRTRISVETGQRVDQNWTQGRVAAEEKSRWKVRDLLADERCSRAVLDFLATTDVGRLVPAPAEGTRRASRRSANSGSGESGRRREEQRLRSWAPGPWNRCFSARPPLWYLQDRSRGRGSLSFVFPFYHSSFFFFGALSIFLGTAWAEGRGKLASGNESPAREQRRINGQKIRGHSLYRLNASMIKPKKKWVLRTREVGRCTARCVKKKREKTTPVGVGFHLYRKGLAVRANAYQPH